MTNVGTAFCNLIKRLERLSTRHSIKWTWSSGESKSLDNMQRAIVCLILILTPCGGMAAEFALSGPANAPIANRASGKATPAKELFGAMTAPAPLVSRAIGTYARGCLSGGVALPISGPNWQVMRLSRNRNWGHPRLVSLLERLANDGRRLDGWPGLLVGDIAQPRGGPMITGHESHQIGLDADIWLTPMPNRLLTRKEREDLMATSMLKDPFTVDMHLWTPLHTKLIKRAASYPEVERIFVHPAIKQVLCDQAGADRAWLSKVRPWWGHYYHFHVRIACPPGDPYCQSQSPVSGDDGCRTELDDWFKKLRQAERQAPGTASAKPPLTLDDLPVQCRTVLAYGQNNSSASLARTQASKWTADKPAGPPPPHY
jgi:penicillin-insensitive murein DD-endopeptidase